MEKHLFILGVALTLAGLSACTNGSSKGGLVKVQVDKSYPVRPMKLSEVADFSYVQPQADTAYFYKGRPIALTAHRFVMYDRTTDGLLFFDRTTGKPISRFSHHGNGPQEYTFIQHAVYDETSDEVFIYDPHLNQILVYNSKGTYKRSLPLPKDWHSNNTASFDASSLLVYDTGWVPKPALRKEPGYSPFMLISKTDGHILQKIKIPWKDIVLGVPFSLNQISNYLYGITNRVVACQDGYMLCNPEADTVFFFGKDRQPKPVLVQTPPAASHDPKIYLDNLLDAPSYQFMEAVTVQRAKGAFPFPSVYLIRDKKTGKIYTQQITLDDYAGKQLNFSPRQVGSVVKDGACIDLDLGELKQALAAGKLSGRLKAIVSASDAEKDNDIYLLVHFK